MRKVVNSSQVKRFGEQERPGMGTPGGIQLGSTCSDTHIIEVPVAHAESGMLSWRWRESLC